MEHPAHSKGNENGHVGKEEAILLVDGKPEVGDIEKIEVNLKSTKTKKRRCRGCREWAACCCEVGHEINRLCHSLDCKNTAKKCCSSKTVKRKLPILQWLPKYRLPHFQGDLIAGFTVGLTVIPQGLALAQLAELPPQYGLYSAFMGCFVYCILGTAKDITLGPTAIMSLMTAEFGGSWVHLDATVAIVLSLFCGLIQLLMGILSVGFLVDFISYPVINSFTTAAAIIIAFGQTKKWFGLKGMPRDFIHQVVATAKKIKEIQLWDFLLGLGCLIILYLMKKMKNIKYNDNGREVSRGIRVGRKILWLLGTARNAIVVILAATLAAVLSHYGYDVFTVTDRVEPGLPQFAVPKFTLQDGNTTYYAEDIFRKIGSGFLIVPLLSLIETIAIGKAFARKNNYNIDANQELLAIGVSNILGAFVSAYPVTGSFSRTAVNSQSGVKTPAGGIWTGALVLLALGFLTPLFKLIPEAALACVIIMAVLDMASFAMLLKLWRVKRLDLVPWLATFIFSFVLGIEYGILIGIGLSAMFLMFPWARPGLTVQKGQVVIVQLDSGIRFPGVEYLREKVIKEALRDDAPKPVVLDCSHVSALDFSTANGLIALFEDFKLHKSSLILANMKPDIFKVLDNLHSPFVRHVPTVEEAVKILEEETEQEEAATALLSGPQEPPSDDLDDVVSGSQQNNSTEN